MNSPAIAALKRAMLRLSAHSWRQGPVADGNVFSGYSLKDAIIGRLAVGSAERDALSFATDAAQFIYPAQDLPNDDAFLDAWNDKLDRTSDQVYTVLNIAIGRAELAPEPTPEICPAVDSAAPIAAPAAVMPASDDAGLLEATQVLRDIHAGNQGTLQTLKANIDAISASGGDATPPAPPPPELVAQAIALGYEVDGTWTEARLRAAIATAKKTDAKLALLAVKLPDPIEPMPTPPALMSKDERASFFMTQNSPRTKP